MQLLDVHLADILFPKGEQGCIYCNKECQSLVTILLFIDVTEAVPYDGFISSPGNLPAVMAFKTTPILCKGKRVEQV